MLANQPLSTRRRSVELALAEMTQFTRSFRTQLKELLCETGLYTFLAAVTPCLVVAWVSSYYRRRADGYYAKQAVTTFGGASAYPNMTAVPLNFSKHLQFFMLPDGNYGVDEQVLLVVGMGVATATQLTRALVLFRPKSLRGKLFPVLHTCVVTAIAVLLLSPCFEQSSQDGYYNDKSLSWFNLNYINILFLLPAVFPLTEYLARPDSTGLLTLYLKFFVYNLFENVTIYVVRNALPTRFFDHSTSVMTKFALKFVLQSVFGLLFMEGAWQMNCWLGSKRINNHDASKFFVNVQTALSSYGRFMQGSATTLGQAALFELSGTLSELLMADQLLRGKTPVAQQIEMTLEIRRMSLKKIKRELEEDYSGVGFGTSADGSASRRKGRRSSPLLCERAGHYELH